MDNFDQLEANLQQKVIHCKNKSCLHVTKDFNKMYHLLLGDPTNMKIMFVYLIPGGGNREDKSTGFAFKLDKELKQGKGHSQTAQWLFGYLVGFGLVDELWEKAKHKEFTDLHVLKDVKICVWITNAFKCRWNSNKIPSLDESKECVTFHLQQEIELLKPKLILAMGDSVVSIFKNFLPGRPILPLKHSRYSYDEIDLVGQEIATHNSGLNWDTKSFRRNLNV